MSSPVLRHVVSDLPPYVAGRRAQSALTAALASNESHYPPLPSVLEAVGAASDRINRYPDIASVELRQHLADHIGVTSDELAVGPGSVGVLQQIITSMCDPGDEVIFAWRSFEAYPLLVDIAGARGVRVPLLPDESHDLDAMAAAVTDRTRLVLLCSPNNPTGVPVTAAELVGFLSNVRDDVLVVIDEAYIEYATHSDAIDSLSVYRSHPNICILRTFSKAYGLAGLRVGYAITAPPLAEGLRRTAIPFGVSTFAQRAAIASLDADAEMRDRVMAVTAERDRVIAGARSRGWQVPESQANFLWLRVDDAAREGLVTAFADADILVRGYPGDGVRVTLADPAANDRVLAVLDERNRIIG